MEHFFMTLCVVNKNMDYYWSALSSEELAIFLVGHLSISFA